MQDTLQIVCPKCGGRLIVRNTSGIERMTVPCPICGTKSPFTAFRKVVERGDDVTQVPGSGDDGPVYPALPGAFRVDGGGVLALREGEQVIGRRSPRSCAALQIDTGGERRVSREHLKVEVRRTGSGYRHLLSLAKSEVNPTFVNGVRLSFGDCIELKEGMTVGLPGIDMTFFLPDPDATMID